MFAHKKVCNHNFSHLSASTQRDNNMAKQHKCSKCSNEYSNRHNLSRHRKLCEASIYSNQSSDSQYRPVSVDKSADHSSDVFPTLSKPANPKISALMDAIVNDGDEPSTPSMMPEKIPEKKIKNLPDIEFEEESSGESCDEDTNGSMDDDDKQYPESLNLTSKDMSDDGDEDDPNDEENGDDDPDDDDRESYSGIEPMDLTAIDTSDVDDEEDMDFEDEFEEEKEAEKSLHGKVSKASEYLTQHDVQEMRKILDDLAEDTMIEEEVALLQKLIPKFLDDENPDMTPIEDVIVKIKSHDQVPKSLLARFMMLLKDIRRNNFRVSDILRRMKAIFDDEYAVKEDISRGLKTLAQEQLISDDQFNTLMAMVDTLNMEKLIQVVVNEKIGRGIQFLPRKTEDLLQKLGEWLKYITKKHHLI